MLCPVNFILPYEIRLCDIVATFKSEYKKLVEKNFEKKIKKYSPMDCLHADDEKMKKIFLEFQEEIWEANFIVFSKYFIYEKGESFQQFLRSFSGNKNQVNERMEMVFGSLRFFILHEKLPEYFGKLGTYIHINI
uniref:Uncharacterized protein n=1 Tax=Meloidogyne enterolobii TaxID=390850 RepID=A0A6V7WBP7_MELEN|nr:unnamed protein product [Meloidogyne enterolobii]